MNRDTKPLRRQAPKPLTTTAIAGLKAGKMLADGAIRPGSGSLKVRKRITAGGVVTEWVFEWHRQEKTVRQSLGRYAVAEAPNCLTLTQARAEAGRLQALIKTGGDPVAEREIEREGVRVRQAAEVAVVREAKDKTLSALLDAYVTSLKAKKKVESAYDAENMFANHVTKPFPDLASLPASAVVPQHIARILVRLVGPAVEKKKGRTALKLRSYMAAAFKLALGASVDPMAPASASGFGLTINPASAVPATSMAAVFNRSGERALSPDEFRHYLAHLVAVPSPLPRLALQLQVASAGQRLQQLLRLTGVDINGSTLTLYDPKGRRTQPRPHVLPLIPEIEEVLGAVKEQTEYKGGLVFINGKAAMAPETVSGVVRSISDTMISEKQTATPFRGGDIRRTIETMLAETLHISKDVRAQLLSHGLSGVQDKHYDKGVHLPAKTAALRAWNDYVAELCAAGPPAENVVPIGKRAA